MYETTDRSRRAERRDALLEQAARLKKASRPPSPPMSPPLAAAYLQQAEQLRDQGRPVEALASFTLAAKGPRYAVHALRRRAQVEEEIGDLETAIGTLKHTLHHTVGDDRRTGAIYTDIGDIYARRGQASEAEYYFRRAQRLAPDDDGLQARLDWCAHAEGGLDATTSRTDLGAVHA